MKEEKIVKNVLLSNIYQILILIVPFITAPYISRVLGANGVGIYSYVNSIQTYFTMFATLGTVTYGAREISRIRNDKTARSYLFWEIELLSIITTMVCLVIWGVLTIFYTEYQIYFIALTPCLLAVMFDISWFYTGLEQFKHIVLQNGFFKILSVIMLFIFVRDSNDTQIYIGIMAISTFLGNLTMWIYLPQYIQKVEFKKLRVFRHFKETLIYFIPTIATSLYTVLDKTLIGLITHSYNENGYYEQATKIVNMSKAVSFTAFNNVLGSRIAYLFVQNKEEEIKNRIQTSMSFIMLMGIGFIFGLTSTANTFIPVFFGPGYDKTVILLQFMSPLVVIVGISSCIGAQYYTPAGLRKQSAGYIIVGSFVNLCFNLLLIPMLNSFGAVIGSIIAETVVSSLYLKNCKYYRAIDLIKSSWKKVISGLLMSLVILLIGRILKHGIVCVAVQIISGCIVYIVLLYLLKDEIVLKFSSGIQEYIVKRIKRKE